MIILYLILYISKPKSKESYQADLNLKEKCVRKYPEKYITQMCRKTQYVTKYLQ